MNKHILSRFFLPLCHWNSWPTIDGTPMSKNLTLIKRFKTLNKTQRKHTNWTLENHKSIVRILYLPRKGFLFRWNLHFSRSGTPNPTASIKKLNYWESNTISDFGAKKYLDSVTRINQKYWHFLSLLKVARTVIATVNTWLPSSSFREEKILNPFNLTVFKKTITISSRQNWCLFKLNC